MFSKRIVVYSVLIVILSITYGLSFFVNRKILKNPTESGKKIINLKTIDFNVIKIKNSKGNVKMEKKDGVWGVYKGDKLFKIYKIRIDDLLKLTSKLTVNRIATEDKKLFDNFNVGEKAKDDSIAFSIFKGDKLVKKFYFGKNNDDTMTVFVRQDGLDKVYETQNTTDYYMSQNADFWINYELYPRIENNINKVLIENIQKGSSVTIVKSSVVKKDKDGKEFDEDIFKDENGKELDSKRAQKVFGSLNYMLSSKVSNYSPDSLKGKELAKIKFFTNKNDEFNINIFPYDNKHVLAYATSSDKNKENLEMISKKNAVFFFDYTRIASVLDFVDGLNLIKKSS